MDAEDDELVRVKTIVPIMAMPEDPALQTLHTLYKPSLEVTKLKSEQGRSVFCEEFIEDNRLGPLTALCTRSLAQNYVVGEPLPLVADDVHLARLFTKSISIDLPLEQSHRIDDEIYWQEVVQQKDKGASLRPGETWKQRGITMRFADFLEEQSVEYFNEDEVEPLIMKVKDYITHLHIRHLKALSERSVEEKLRSLEEGSSESESDYDESSSSEEPSSLTSSIRISGRLSRKSEGEGEVEPAAEEQLGEEESEGSYDDVMKKFEEIALEEIDEEYEQVKAARQAVIAEAAAKAEEERKQRHKERREKRKLAAIPPPKKRKKKIKSVFDIPISEDEDEDAQVNDRRNLARYLKFKASYKYPPEDCHHISLRCIRHLDSLVSFTLEFKTANLEMNYHKRFLNFSYRDMHYLASGLSFLQDLKTFRLINSRMDALKLEILAEVLRTLPSLETVDFSYDGLKDDCCYGLVMLLRDTTSIKSLELKGNKLGNEALNKLAVALMNYSGDLQYLGLSQNPLGDAGVHALIDTLIKYEQVDDLDLGATQISQEAIMCCVANELLREHRRLRSLDLVGLIMQPEAALEFIKAATDNYTILHLDCRGCDLEYQLEEDVEVIVKRNRYLVENPYIGDNTKTEQEIYDFIKQKKHPVYLRVLEDIAARDACLSVRPKSYEYADAVEEEELLQDAHSHSITLSGFGSALVIDATARPKLAFNLPTVESESSTARDLIRRHAFVYDISKLNEEEFLGHVQQPGPDNRFMYFYKRNHILEFEDDDLEVNDTDGNVKTETMTKFETLE